MEINVDDPNWRFIFSLISEHQLMILQKSLDKKTLRSKTPLAIPTPASTLPPIKAV
ncbi:MAG: hypothetical protein ABSF53_17300 [Terracidiphilus sp.]|jgi:hypothetical protein